FSSVVTRFDTQVAFFDQATSWSTFDTTGVDANAKNFFGSVFDGRYVYFVPTNGIITRYDTQASFSATTSWVTFDTSRVFATALHFSGAAFDDRYVYLVPFVDSVGSPSGMVLRYDTQATTFADTAAWSSFDATTVNANAMGFLSAAFDGRFVYFVPLAGPI